MPLKSLNGGCASITGYRLFLYSPAVKLPPSSKQSHLPQRILLICKGGACKAAKFSALMPRRDSLLKLSLSSFFAPMSQGDFSTYPHSVHFSGHGIAPPAISTASVSDPCHVSCLFKQKGGFMLHKKGHGTSSMSTRLGMLSRDTRERVVVRTGQLVCFNSLFLAVLISVCFREKSKIPQQQCLAVPFSAGWGMHFPPTPVPHQLPCRNKSSGYQDHGPQALQSLNGLTCIPSLVSLATMLTLGLIKTFIPTAIFLLWLFTQQLSLMRWVLRVTHIPPPVHLGRLLRRCYLASECRFTASISHFMLATLSLPCEDTRGRCLSTLYREHLQQKCPKLLPRTLPAPPGAFLTSASLTKEVPAVRLHRQPHQHSEQIKKMAPKSLEKTAACSYRKQEAVSPTG